MTNLLLPLFGAYVSIFAFILGAISNEESDHHIAYVSLWWTDEQRAWQAQVTQQRTKLDAEYGTARSNLLHAI